MLYFVFEGNFQVQAPRGAYIWRGDLTEGFLRYEFGGAYIWRGLYMEEIIFGSLRYVIRKWHIALWGYMKQSPSTVYKYALLWVLLLEDGHSFFLDQQLYVNLIL